MLTPTQDQWMGQLRQLLPVIGTLLTALGWITPEAWAGYTTIILTVAGPLMIFGSMVWSLIANSRKSIMISATKNLEDAAPAEKAAMVKAVAELPAVAEIKLDPTVPEARVINASTPENVKIAA